MRDISLKSVAEEFMGCVVAACLSAAAFFLPFALKWPLAYEISCLVFFLSLLVYETLQLNALLNPATHLQKLLMHRTREEAMRFAIGSFADMTGYVVGNYVSLLALQRLDETVSFVPETPKITFFQVVLVEGLIFFALQWFSMRVSQSMLYQSLFCTVIVFAFLEVTGSYSSPAAYYSKVLVSGAAWFDPIAAAYFAGPFLGAIAAIPLMPRDTSETRRKVVRAAKAAAAQTKTNKKKVD